ncbi:hypothetical protein [Nocardioides sp.]|uniref:hypothetical protein n=1 Tax=Nocardioides sp. TaxID=35761 RepID=UPI00286C1747|nr:hypothetical protein [Nocardioides sp.]
MNLRDRIAQDLDRTDQVGPDIARLTAQARSRGKRLALLRRAAATGGTLVALTIGAVLVASPWNNPRAGTEGTVATDPATHATSPSPRPSSPVRAEDETGPATARGAAAALVSALSDVTDSPTSDYVGQGPRAELGDSDYYAQIRLEDDGGPANVEINVQFDGGFIGGCSETMDECRSARLPDGATITSYVLTGDKAPGDIRSVAELVRADGVRVVVAATNSITRPGVGTYVTRPEPSLTGDQIRSIALQEYWNEELPAVFLEAGKTLEPFRAAAS